MVQRIRSNVYLRETHVWYEIPLETDRPRLTLPPGLKLVRGDYDDLPLLAQLPTTPTETAAKRRMGNGGELWLVLDEQRPAFACWIFHRSMPMAAAPSSRLVLSPEIVCLENSVTSSLYRGQGIAPAAWSGIADALKPTGVKYIITKIEESNTASRRAIVKCGFRESATMRFALIGLWQRTLVQGRNGVTGGWLAQQLHHEGYSNRFPLMRHD